VLSLGLSLLPDDALDFEPPNFTCFPASSEGSRAFALGCCDASLIHTLCSSWKISCCHWAFHRCASSGFFVGLFGCCVFVLCALALRIFGLAVALLPMRSFEHPNRAIFFLVSSLMHAAVTPDDRDVARVRARLVFPFPRDINAVRSPTFFFFGVAPDVLADLYFFKRPPPFQFLRVFGCRSPDQSTIRVALAGGRPTANPRYARRFPSRFFIVPLLRGYQDSFVAPQYSGTMRADRDRAAFLPYLGFLERLPHSAAM